VILFVNLFRRGVENTSWDGARKKRFIRTLIICIAVWTLFVSIWSLSGRMEDFSVFPFNFMPVLLIPMIAAIAWISSSAVSQVLSNLPPADIIRLQSFRFFVEVLLWLLFTQNLLPVQMTFEGRNFDIVAGITAPIVAYLASRGKISRGGLIAWNVFGLCLLINIVVTAVLSTPSPWRIFMNEPANYIVTYFPISWLPGLLVPLAYYLHFLSIRQLVQDPVGRVAAKS
jgi:hypothetical protein